MSEQEFVSALGLCLGLVSGAFFCIGAAQMRAGDVRRVAGSGWGGNPGLQEFFVALKADYLCGAIALMAAFVAQLVAITDGVLSQEELFNVPALGSVVSLATAAVAFALLWLGRNIVIRRLCKELAEPQGNAS